MPESSNDGATAWSTAMALVQSTQPVPVGVKHRFAVAPGAYTPFSGIGAAIPQTREVPAEAPQLKPGTGVHLELTDGTVGERRDRVGDRRSDRHHPRRRPAREGPLDPRAPREGIKLAVAGQRRVTGSRPERTRNGCERRPTCWCEDSSPEPE